jgi:hypothetical protein
MAKSVTADYIKSTGNLQVSGLIATDGMNINAAGDINTNGRIFMNNNNAIHFYRSTAPARDGLRYYTIGHNASTSNLTFCNGYGGCSRLNQSGEFNNNAA